MTRAPTAGVRTVSRFIPLTRQAVIASLCKVAERDDTADDFSRLVHLLQRHRSVGYRRLAEEIRSVYLPFNPDRDTLQILPIDAAQKSEREGRLAQLIDHLLERANFSTLTDERLSATLSAQSPYSLRIEVDLKEYDLLQVHIRDPYTRSRTVRRPETGYLLKATYEETIYRRLFMMLKLKSNEDRAREVAAERGISLKAASRHVAKRRRQLPPDTATDLIYVKVFKDMPEHDLQILFPLRIVQFRPFDKMKFFATAGGGTLFGMFSTTGKVLAATNPFAAVGALVGFITLLARQVTTFFNQRTRYMMELAQKLFFHNLANNRAAITLLLDRAEEEDVKEDLITLYFNAGLSVEERSLGARKRAIEEIIVARCGVAVDFELPDALARLEADGVVRREGEVVVFPTLAEAAARYKVLIASDERDEARHLCTAGEEVDAMEA